MCAIAQAFRPESICNLDGSYVLDAFPTTVTALAPYGKPG